MILSCCCQTCLISVHSLSAWSGHVITLSIDEINTVTFVCSNKISGSSDYILCLCFPPQPTFPPRTLRTWQQNSHSPSFPSCTPSHPCSALPLPVIPAKQTLNTRRCLQRMWITLILISVVFLCRPGQSPAELELPAHGSSCKPKRRRGSRGSSLTKEKWHNLLPFMRLGKLSLYAGTDPWTGRMLKWDVCLQLPGPHLCPLTPKEYENSDTPMQQQQKPNLS